VASHTFIPWCAETLLVDFQSLPKKLWMLYRFCCIVAAFADPERLTTAMPAMAAAVNEVRTERAFMGVTSWCG
jgi:hypothetical protein